MWKSRLTIVGLAVIASIAISTIYTYLSNINSLDVIGTNSQEYHNGIACYKELLTTQTTTHHCNSIAKQVAQNITSDSKWNCSQYTDVHNITLIKFSTDIRNLWYLIVIFSSVYGISLILHDLYLLNYGQNHANNPDYCPFYPIPENESDSTLCTCKYIHRINTNFKPCWCLLKVLMWLLYKPMECRNGCWSLLCFIILLPLLCVVIILSITLDGLVYCIYACMRPVYTSALNVGLSRTMISVLVAIILVSISDGIMKKIENTNSCSCYCVYNLTDWDYLLFMATTYVLIFTGFILLYSWVTELDNQKQYLYTITYQLPLSFVRNINHQDPASSIRDDVSLHVISTTNSQSEEKELSNNDQYHIMHEMNIVSATDKSSYIKQAKVIRYIIILLASVLGCMYVLMGVVEVAIKKGGWKIVAALIVDVFLLVVAMVIGYILFRKWNV